MIVGVLWRLWAAIGGIVCANSLQTCIVCKSCAKFSAAIHAESENFHAATSSKMMSGCRAATRNSTRAAPVGFRFTLIGGVPGIFCGIQRNHILSGLRRQHVEPFLRFGFRGE